MYQEYNEALPNRLKVNRSPLWTPTHETQQQPKPQKKMRAIAWTPGTIETSIIRPCVNLFVDRQMTPERARDKFMATMRSRYGKEFVPIAIRVQNVFTMLPGNPWGDLGNFLLAASNNDHELYFSPWVAWFDQFFQMLKDEGVVVDEVMLDEEHSFSPWGINGMVPDAKAFYQTWAPIIAPEYFESYQFNGRYFGLSPDAIYAFGEAIGSPLDLFYRKVFVEMVRSYWGEGIPCSNYNDMYPQHDVIPTRTENKSEGSKTWVLGSSGVTDIQAPEIYFTGGGNAFSMWPQHPRWEHILMNFNNLNSMRLTNNLIRPWLPTIGYGGPVPIDEMTQEQLGKEVSLMLIYMRHLADIGIDTFYFWNWDFNSVQYKGVSLFEWMAIIMDQVDISPNPAQPTGFPPGVGVLDTGGIRTDYDDILPLLE